MRTSNTPRRPSLLLAALLSGAALLSACDRPDDNRSAGQRVDEAVATTERKTEQAGAEVREAGREAGADVKEAARDAGQALKNAGETVADKTRDAAITAEVKTRLARDDGLSALAIDVDTRDGRVALRGAAPDTAARSRATELARSVDGVVAVNNELSVQAVTVAR